MVKIRMLSMIVVLTLLMLLQDGVFKGQMIASIYEKLILEMRWRMHVFAGLALASTLNV